MGIGRIGRVDPDHLHEMRDDAARLAAPAAAGPACRARRAVEGIASLAPDDTELRRGRARKAGPDARAETRRPRRPTEDTIADQAASMAAAYTARDTAGPAQARCPQGRSTADKGRGPLRALN